MMSEWWVILLIKPYEEKSEKTYSFCYLDDLIEGIIRLINSEQTCPIKIGNPNEFTFEN